MSSSDVAQDAQNDGIKENAFSEHYLTLICVIRRIGHDQSVRDTEDKTQEEEGDGCSPKSLHKLNQNLEHSSTATSAVGLPPTPPDDLDDADSGGGGGLFRNGNPPLLSSPSSAGSIRYGSNFGFSHLARHTRPGL